MTGPFVFLEDCSTQRQRLYKNPLEVIEARTLEDIVPALMDLQQAHATGHYLVGWFAYELGYLLDTNLEEKLPDLEGPLLQFGVFKSFDRTRPVSAKCTIISRLQPAWSLAQYQERFEKINRYIRAGDVYQINLAFPITGEVQGRAFPVYNALVHQQPVKYGAVISLSTNQIISLSPELFFDIDHGKITLRPMKGTIRRGMDATEDARLANALQGDAKNRAENLMIVDLLRNDAARIAEVGSVEVRDLFKIETYPSLHTMTSTVHARLKSDLLIEDILRALFPCGSVTGAPKIRAMEIIRDLEDGARGAYCGAIGLIDPDGHMRFSVGIRTLTVSPGGKLIYPVGSGVVADSDVQAEYEECLLKGRFLNRNLN